MVVQQSYAVNPPQAFPGMIAEPNSPTRVERGVLHLDSTDARATATPAGARPGDAVFYDTGEDAWRVAYNAASQLNIMGIITYPADTVADANSFVTYADGAEIEVVTMGVVWVQAGGDVTRASQLQFQTDDFKYDALTRVTAITDMVLNPISCYSQSGADNSFIKAAIGMGRVI